MATTTDTAPDGSPQPPEPPGEPEPQTGKPLPERPPEATAQAPTISTLRRLAPYVRPIRGRLFLSGGLSVLGMCCGLAIPLVIERIVDGPVADGDTGGIWPGALLVLVLSLAEAALFGFRRLATARPLPRLEARMRADLYRHLQTRPVTFHDGWQSGQLLSRATNDLVHIRMFLGFVLIFLFVNSATLIVGLGILFSLNWLLALPVLAAALVLIPAMHYFDRHYRVLSRRAQDQVGDLATVSEESILGIRILKAFGRHRSMENQFRSLARELRGTELRKVRMLSNMWAITVALPEIAVGVSLYLGIRQGNNSAGELIAFFSIVLLLRWPMESLGWLIAGTSDAAAATARFFDVMDSHGEIPEPAEPTELPQATGLLTFEDVHFRFPDSRTDVLRGVDLTIRPGETIALVGGTGSGKTTLTSLVPRLYDVTGGRIRLDGVDVRDLPLHRLRELVSVAFEESILFSASVRENVLLGFPEGTDEDVRRALDVAQAGFAFDLPYGLETRIGEEGLNLSGGQRQRLALARAVAARPAFLVLDDPLSALDVHTEALVEQALRRVLATTTALVVAHRPSTVQLADRVAVLRDGRITAVGTHDELLAGNGHYRHLMSTLEVA